MTTASAPGVIPEWTQEDRLRKSREHAGLDQDALAAALGVSRRTISNAERGAHKVRPITLRAWSLATGVPVEWLETGTAPTDPSAPFGVVRHQGLEPRTRWFSVVADQVAA